MAKILKNSDVSVFNGCDFVLQFDKGYENKKIKLLQLTDMQFIDCTQRRTPDRLTTSEINAWRPENFDAQCGNQIRSLVTQTKPDLIFITGDIIYGGFDDKGTTFEWFCNLMESLSIPWAPVFGNHDNESLMGVDWQCEKLINCKHCLFKRGDVSGNGNYSIGIAIEDKLIRVLHMLDSNGCRATQDPSVVRDKGIYKDQIELLYAHTVSIREAQHRDVPSFVAFHIPTKEFETAEISKGYRTEERMSYTIGADVPAVGDDFGCKHNERIIPIRTEYDFVDAMKKCNTEAVFVGHHHCINTCIEYEGIRWTFGLKTGQYDYHIPGQLGGTLITVENDSFSINHVCALVPCAPYPLSRGNNMFENFFAEENIVL